jgi:uncharacterized membrane protein
MIAVESVMTIQPLVAAPLAVQLHVATVVPAFFLGTWLLFGSTKGSRHHRLVGKVYLGLMSVTALAAIFIRSFASLSITVGPLKLGLIHLFVLLTGWSVWRTLGYLRTGQIEGHKQSMRGMYFGALIVAGLLAFAPGRIMYRMFFG